MSKNFDELKKTFAFKFGQVASEVSRARAGEEANDSNLREHAFTQALRLTDQIITQEKSFCRKQELSRFREALASLYVGQNVFHVSLKELEDYCLPFALIARKKMYEAI